MKPTFKKLVDASGTVLAFFSIIFVFIKFYDYLPQIRDVDIGKFELVFLIAVGSLVYFLSSFFLVLSWRNILAHVNVNGDLSKFYFLYGVTNLAKYIPGNIFQYAGRQVACVAHSFNSKQVAKSIGFEVILLAVNGIVSGLLVFFDVYSLHVLVLVIIPVVVVLLFSFFSRCLLTSFLCQACFLIINSIIFVSVLSAFVELPFDEFYFVALIYVFSWFVGFITPGSPAGVGIREAVLLFFLSTHISDAALLSAVLISRMISVFGDVIFFISAKFVGFRCKFHSNVGA